MSYTKFTSIIILYAILLLQSKGVFSQNEDWLQINFNSNFESILQLNIDSNAQIEFGIKEINDGLFQITKYPSPVMFSVESTSNWNLSISATDENFTGVNDSSLKIPVSFVGYSIESYGTNWDNGSYSNILNIAKDTLLALSNKNRQILKNGKRNNIGGNNENFFVIKWGFFDKNNSVLVKKLSAFNLKDDRFKVGLKLTLSESLLISSE